MRNNVNRLRQSKWADPKRLKMLANIKPKRRASRYLSGLIVLFAREDDGHGNGTQKPVERMRRPVENNSSPRQAVYEPFSGSGTTIVAAEMTGRSCYAIELDPAYVDVAVLRWQAFTGQAATLECDGRPFADIAVERWPEKAD